jgi:hypothetical protein
MSYFPFVKTELIVCVDVSIIGFPAATFIPRLSITTSSDILHEDVSVEKYKYWTDVNPVDIICCVSYGNEVAIL